MDQLISLIVAAAQRLGFEAGRVWPDIVMVVFVRSLAFLVLDVVGLVGAIVGLVIVARMIARRYAAQRDAAAAYHDKRGKDPWATYTPGPDLSEYMFGGALACVPLVAVGLLCALTLPYNLAGALYPEAVTVIGLVQGAIR